MLKPKRKRTIKEIKQDPLLETVYKGQQLFEDNRQLILRVGGGLIAVLVIVLMIRGSRSSAATEADNIMASAMSHFGAGNHGAAVADLDHLIDEYGSTESGETALFYLAQVQFDGGNREEARLHAESYISKGESQSHRAGAHLILAELLEMEDDYNTAAEHYLSAAELAYTPVTGRRSRLNAVRCLLESGALDRAGELIGTLEEGGDAVDPLRSELTRLKSRLQILSDQ